MARPSKRQLACRNANKARAKKAQERRETEGSEDNDANDTPVPDDDLSSNNSNNQDTKENDRGEAEAEGEAQAEERQLREKLSGAGTAPVSAPVPAPVQKPVQKPAPIAPAPPVPTPAAVAKPVSYPPNTRYNAPQPTIAPFQYHHNLPPPGHSYSGPSSSSFFASGPPPTGPQYMTHASPQANSSLPPLQTFIPQHQSYPPQPAPPLPPPPQQDGVPQSGSAVTPSRPIPEVSNYNFISGKPVCRQTLWRRKKRAEAAALNAVPEPPEPDPVRQHREEMAEAVEKWPRVPTAKMKEDILDAAINDMEKLLKSKVRRPKGQDFNRHQQVLQFMNIQRMNRSATPRMDLALTVANMYRKGREVADRIVRHEKEWVKRRIIPAGGQGKNAKIPSMLEDEGTVECIRAHIEAMGEKLTAAGLAVAVSTYWQSEKAYEDDVMADAEENGEPPPDNEARKKKLTLSSRTASTWLGKLGYVFEDGIYRYKGVQPVIAPPQEGGAGGYL